MAIKTVGDLIKTLQAADPKLPVFVSVYVSSMTEAGTDPGEDETRDIAEVVDLETRVVIEAQQYRSDEARKIDRGGR